MMQIFNGVVRLQGEMRNEVAKRGLTVPEVYVLKRIHGNDGVVRLQHVGYADIDPLDERERLKYEYADGLRNLGDDATDIEKMFGGDFAPLPEELREYEGALVEREDTLAEFQKPEPYASPDVEDRGAQIRRKAAAKRTEKKESPPVKAAAKGSKTLEAVM